jgi:hypothetical protein
MPDYTVPVPGGCIVFVTGFIGGRIIQNSFTFVRPESEVNATTLHDCGDMCIDWWRAEVVPSLSFEYTNFVAEVFNFNPFPFPESAIFRTFQNGGVSDKSLPNNCALRIDFRTGIPGRAYRGWSNICGIPQQYHDGNLLDTSFVDALVGRVATLITQAPTVGWTWGVMSTIEAGAPRASGFVTPITDVLVTDYVVDSCRQRLPGH